MISRRLAAVVLGLLALLGCHEDPTVVKVTVSASADAFSLSSIGGTTFVPSGVVATAGTGGSVTVGATGPINLGSGATIPSAPALPSAPGTGTELTNAMIGTTVVGNILISSTLQITGAANPAVITTNNGDVVISGTLIAERGAGATTNGITINAPAGTIYVLGAIRASGTAGAPDNPNGGAVALLANRIVMTGSIDTSGETEAAAPGGLGGQVSLLAGPSGEFVYFTGGSIVTSGGSGTTSGGKGGDVTLSASNRLAVYAPITANGGTANSAAVSPTGGQGGVVTLTGPGGVDVVSTIQMIGGDSTGVTQGAIGGAGGAFNATSPAPYRLYGLIANGGGSATATAVGGGAVTAGNGGAVNIGAGPRVSSLEIGLGTYSIRGGQGASGGGNAGSFTIESIDGDIAVRSSLIARGGDAAGPGNGNGGNGGSISIKADANVAGNLSNHSLSIPSLETLLDSSGGTPLGGNGGTGNTVTLQSGGDLTFGARIVSSGGSDSVSGAGGSAGAVSLLIDTANTVPAGDLIVGGSITAEGGLPVGSAAGGNGNTIVIQHNKGTSIGGITCSATLSTVGGGNGAGGNAGPISIVATLGNIALSGSISAAGRSGLSAAGGGRNVVVTSFGSIISSAVIVTNGGSGTDTASGVAGANAGNVNISATTATGSVTLSGTSISASGGAATLSAAGGTGGIVTVLTIDQPVSITGSITALGGSSPTGAGGLGGQVVVNTDSGGNGIGGAITLTSGSVINVSGGTGTVGGFTRNNGGVAPANSTGAATLCVIFDAAGDLTATPDGGNEGIVQNLGAIIATGGSPLARGGDVWFDGKNAAGVDLTLTDGGSLTLTGALGSGAFFPN
ncbi:MAG TPA: hypothetical protein VNM14_25525 [Planctomycetota bacterium]|nr:hypothetical protein [Planctomycetota bacterium]